MSAAAAEPIASQLIAQADASALDNPATAFIPMVRIMLLDMMMMATISRADMTKPRRPNYSETTAALGNFGNRHSESAAMQVARAAQEWLAGLRGSATIGRPERL
jgi:hypothetical protein